MPRGCHKQLRAWAHMRVRMSEHVVVKLCLVLRTFVIPQTSHKFWISRSRFGHPQRFHICATRLPQAVARVGAHESVDV